MDFVDIKDVGTYSGTEGRRLDRKVICDICSTMSDNLYVNKLTFTFDREKNIYYCTHGCKQVISGLVVERMLYFNKKDFIYEPEIEKKEATLKIKFAGLDENDEVPEHEFVSLGNEPLDP